MSRRRLSAQDLDLALAELAELGDVDQVLRRHPRREQELAPLLYAASRAQNYLTQVPSPPRGLQDGRRRLLAEAAQMRATRRRWFDWLPSLRSLWTWPQRLSPPLRVVAIVLLLLVNLSSVSGGVVLAAEQSLPGDLLYPVKEKVEDMRLSIARDPASLTLYYTERRLQDIDEAMQRGKSIPEPTVHRLEWQFTYLIERAKMDADSGDPTLDGELAGQLRGQVERLDAIAAQMEGAAQQRMVEAKERVSRELDQAEGVMDREPSPSPVVDDGHGKPRPDERNSAQEKPASRPDPTSTPPAEQPPERDVRQKDATDGQPALPTAMPPRTDKADKGQDDQPTTGDAKSNTPEAETEETGGRPPRLPSKAAPPAQDAVPGPDVTPGLPPKENPPGRVDPPKPEGPQTPVSPPSRSKSSGDDEGDQDPGPPPLPSKQVPPVPMETAQPADTGISPEPTATRDASSDGEDRTKAPVEPPALPPKEAPPGAPQKPRPTEMPQP
jgi:hypothetical protein